MPVSRVATGVSLYWEQHGQGEAIVLIPPGTRSGSVWAPYQVPVLSQKYRVVTLDCRGVGQSEAPATKYTIPTMAADVMALLDLLEIPHAHVLGHSIGGRVALQCALTWPDRVSSLILFATGAGGGAGATRGTLNPKLMEQMIEGAYAGAPRQQLGTGGEDHFLSPGFLRDHSDEVERLRPLIGDQHRGIGVLLRFFQARQEWDVSDCLADVRVATLVAVGSDDHASGHVASSTYLAEHIPNARFELIEGARHGFYLEQPERANKLLLDWLDEHSARSA